MRNHARGVNFLPHNNDVFVPSLRPNSILEVRSSSTNVTNIVSQLDTWRKFRLVLHSKAIGINSNPLNSASAGTYRDETEHDDFIYD